MEAIRSAEHVVATKLESLREFQRDVSEELSALASGHADRSNGILTVLETNHEQYPAQKITRAWIESKPDSLDEVVNTATFAEPNFTAVLQKLHSDSAYTNSLSQLGEDLLAGENIIVITNHGEIKDIAVTLAAYYSAIKQTGHINGREYDFQTNILLSKMVAHLGFYGESAVTILGKMCNRQYFSFPKTESIRNSRIAPFVVDTYNKGLRRAIKSRFSDGGNLFAIAPSGTVDKPSGDDPNQLTLATVGTGTVEMLTSRSTKVLPVAIWSQDNQFIFEPLGIPRHMRDETDIHDTMNDIANVLNVLVRQKEFKYDRPSP